jgi:cyanophycinase-like exopeptidase
MNFGKGMLCIMGSGETAPTMVKVHRQLLDGRKWSQGDAVMLDTPFGFQENADELSSKALQYFDVSLNTPFEIATLRRYEEATPLERERFLNSVRSAQYVFAGPGSPTYALRNWASMRLGSIVADKVRDGDTVVFSSAAALTLGAYTLPVYEIYKVGEQPEWREGLDVMSLFGLHAAIIPHYNNQEGGHHDTRFCYMGESRLSTLESQLSEDAIIIGVDEHTALILNASTGSATVVGNSTVTLRKSGHSLVYETGAEFSIDDIRAFALGTNTGPRASVHGASTTQVSQDSESEISSLSDEIDAHETDFSKALSAKDPLAASEALLALESTLAAWSADTLQSDDLTRGRELLRSMIARLGEFALRGAGEPEDVIRPFVDALLELRVHFRTERDFARSDAIRDLLVTTGIEVNDTKDGSTWRLPSKDGERLLA